MDKQAAVPGNADPSLFSHILVPTDGSETAMRAGKMAVQLASVHKSRLTFIYVVDDSVARSLAGASGKDVDQVRRDLETSGQRSLDYLCRLAGRSGIDADQVCQDGEPCDKITTLARERGVDLIVMGQIGNTSMRRILIGYVTESVIENSPCPVLVVGKSG